MKARSPVLLSYAFRPFFLAGGLFAMTIVALWVWSFETGAGPFASPLWHAHELLIGFGLAAVAGFSLTAVAVWTGRPNVRGAPLAWLLLAWLAGRIAMGLPPVLPGWARTALDMLFPLLLCSLFGREVLAARNRRNYKLVLMVAVIAILNLLFHLGATGLVEGGERLATYLLIHAFLVLVAIIAGRITPSFTGNWLRQQGKARLPANSEALAAVAVSLSVLLGVSAAWRPQHPVTMLLAFSAALAHTARLAQWRGFSTFSNPLLFVLHVAYAWLPAGYLCLGLSILGWIVPASSATHALTMGGIGFTVLAVITRVSLGHTGRPLAAARATVLSYWLVALAVLLRVVAPATGTHHLALIEWSAAAWVVSFGLFLWVYWPILSRPRPDA